MEDGNLVIQNTFCNWYGSYNYITSAYLFTCIFDGNVLGNLLKFAAISILFSAINSAVASCQSVFLSLLEDESSFS